jgi:hypothetical protein
VDAENPFYLRFRGGVERSISRFLGRCSISDGTPCRVPWNGAATASSIMRSVGLARSTWPPTSSAL